MYVESLVWDKASRLSAATGNFIFLEKCNEEAEDAVRCGSKIADISVLWR